MKKRSLSLVLAFAMILALACGAWAAQQAVFNANDIPISDSSGDITVNSADYYGLWTRGSNGYIHYTGGTIQTETSGNHIVVAQTSSLINGSGTIITSADATYGLRATTSADIIWEGNVTTYGKDAHGAYLSSQASLDMTGNIETYGVNGRGLMASSGAYVDMTGNITTHNDAAYGLAATNNDATVLTNGMTIVRLVGNVTIYGNSDTSYPGGIKAVAATGSADLQISGDVTAYGDLAVGVGATDGAVVTMTGGTIAVADSDTAYSLSLVNGTITLENVTAEGGNLLICGDENPNASAGNDSSGTLNASDGSVLTGNVIHLGTTTDTLEMNLTDSTWNGSAEASGDVGAIDISLVSSDWNITGDTNTNGKVTADSDSNIDFREAGENIVVEIDNLAGAPGLNIKLDDEFIIKNPDAPDSFQSSDPSVVEVVKNADGSVSIIPRSDGDAELSYSYIDENGKIQTVTIGVVSGAGSDPAGGGGGSSNCNSGVGAALFALLGLAFVYKKK